ncbi:Hypp3811 [Branchiostoma lanceolatum]|uniref:Hypp3811 protein n=1 Tax=Branchiostoma lanceolatum TaxID=7740 RepID=A0A8K0EYK3_BRALA|nr:Hypp3811 [Branchiostoma lanceolatum]
MYRMRRTIGMGLEEVLHDGHANMERRLRDRDDQARREREWVPAARSFHNDDEEPDEVETLNEEDELSDHEELSDTTSLLSNPCLFT